MGDFDCFVFRFFDKNLRHGKLLRGGSITLFHWLDGNRLFSPSLRGARAEIGFANRDGGHASVEIPPKLFGRNMILVTRGADSNMEMCVTCLYIRDLNNF